MSRAGGIPARLGLLPRERERSVWVAVPNGEALEAVVPALAELAGGQKRLRFIFSLAEDSMANRVEQRFPGCRIWPLPFANPVSNLAFLSRGNIRLAVVAGTGEMLSPAIIETLATRAIPLIAMPGTAEEPVALVGKAAEHILRLSEDSTGCGPGRPGHGLTLPAGQAGLLFAELVARDQKEQRAAVSLSGRIGQAMLDRVKHGTGPRLLRHRFHYLADATELRDALGQPDTIMCLGNGPSSEDQALRAMRHDALFRVNHSWLKRGILTEPDVVFTGGRPTLRAVGDAIFGVRTPASERAIMTVRTFKATRRPTRFFNVSNIADSLEAFDWGYYRPTNGAAMLAVAVALQPAKLIVGGIDMFQHPAGSYPGAADTPNAFSPGHDSERELRFLLELFDTYQGDLVIVGDILRARWTEFRRNQTVAT